jgi:hypothetical protein
MWNSCNWGRKGTVAFSGKYDNKHMVSKIEKEGKFSVQLSAYQFLKSILFHVAIQPCLTKSNVVIPHLI